MSSYYRGSSIKFDPATFNVPPSLGKGMSQRLQFWVQSAHCRALDIIAHSGHFPWGKDTDVARWAIQHGLQYITELDRDIHGLSSIMRQANIINANNAQAQRMLTFAENFNKTQEIVMQFKGLGELEMAREHVNKQWREIQAMPDEPESEGRWKMKYIDRFEAMFKDLIDYE